MSRERCRDENGLKLWPSALDFSLDNFLHVCRVKCRERLATLYSDVERCRGFSRVVESNLIKVKIFERKCLLACPAPRRILVQIYNIVHQAR